MSDTYRALLFTLLILLPSAHAATGQAPLDELEALMDQSTDPVRPEPKTPATKPITSAPRASATSTSRWSVLLPAFVIHGVPPTGDAFKDMPRKIDSVGRSVVTPGVGLEYRSSGTFDAIAAFIKDCYDNSAGTLQLGQKFKWREHTDFGYTVGLYIRETPLNCLKQITRTTTRGPLLGTPIRVNTLTTVKCEFQDNLPLRYLVPWGDNYVDIIPTPFLHFTTRIYSGLFDLDFKVMGNFYLNEFGFSVPF